MKISRVDLHAFGPFTNAKLAFDHNPSALQLVYGLNEAGKSTTLRALLALLYGIPMRTGDAHLHEMGKLRVGGVLLDEHNVQHHFVRRKGSKNTLLNEEGKPADETTLRKLLGGLDESLFRQMFGLDHERLRQGAEALLAGGGHVGEGLFDAGTGAHAIRDALTSLEQEADAIFKARGRTTPRLNVAIEALKEHAKTQRASSLSPQEFLDQERVVREARKERDEAVQRRRALREEKARLDRAITQLPLLSRYVALLSEASALPVDDGDFSESWLSQLKSLSARYFAAHKAEANLPRERERAQQLERDIAALKTRVLSAGELQSALDTPTRTRLRKLSEAHEARLNEQRTYERSLDEYKTKQALLREGLVPLGADAKDLAERLLAIERSGLDAALQAVEVDLAQSQSVLSRQADALAVASDAAQLARLQLPSDQSLLALEQRAAELHQAKKASLTRQAAAKARLSELRLQRQRMLAEGELTRLSDLAQARGRRGEILSELRVLATQRSPLELTLVHSLETQVHAADEVSDRLRREAQRAAEFSRLEADLGAAEEEASSALSEREELARAETELSHQAQSLSASLGLGQLAQSELRPRVHKLARLAEHAATHCAHLERAHVLLARARAHIEELSFALGAPPSLHEGDLHDLPCMQDSSQDSSQLRSQLGKLMAMAKRTVEAQLQRAKDHALCLERIHETETLRLGTEEKLRSAARELDALRQTFRDELARLGLSASLTPDETVHTLDELAELERKTRELAHLRGTLEASSLELQQLAGDALSLMQRAAPKLCEAGEVPETGLLIERIEQALSTRMALRNARATHTSELGKLKQQLADASDGASFEELRDHLSKLDASRVRAQREEIGLELEQLDRKVETLDQSIGGKETSLRLLEQPSDAVTLAEEVQSDLSNVRSLVRRYLELRLAATLLKREVESYREKHQGPVLSRASELFPQLTLGKYRALDAMYDERDEAVLCAVLLDGKMKRVGELSDGARDQLYLALRVASIERFLAHNTPLPVILDDAFVHFDDERAAAALKVLAQLCGKTQVIMFTHHQRIVDLAKHTLGRNGVVLHELDPRRGLVNLRDDGPLFSGTP